MNINKFSIVEDRFITEIFGQQSFVYDHSETADIEEVKKFNDLEGYHKGMVIRFYKYEMGEVFEPFTLTRDINYGDVMYHDGLFYFLQADFNKSVVRLIEYYPDRLTKVVTILNMNDIKFNRLMLFGNQVKVVHHREIFVSYYPNKFELSISSENWVVLIEEDKVYINQWIEEGYDDENNGNTNAYYYDKLIVKDLSGNIICDKVGYLSTYHMINFG